MPNPSHSEFARFEDRIDETLEKKIGRVESKLDSLAGDVKKLAVLEDRQLTHGREVDQLRAGSAALSDRWESRAERFDAKLTDLREAYRVLDAKVEKYLQRYVGAGMVVGLGWALITHFWK